MKELLPVAEEPLLNIINSSLSLGHIPKPFKLAVIKPLVKKPKLDPCELANYMISMKNFSQVLGPTIAQKRHFKITNYFLRVRPRLHLIASFT